MGNNIGQNTFDELAGAGSEADLARLQAFSEGGDQDSSNNQLRAEIAKKRAAMQAQAEQQKQMQAADQQRQAMVQQAQGYRAGLPGLQEQMFNPVADDARRNLSSEMAGITKGSNQRGLLYSGLKQGAQSQARGNTAAGLAQARAGINQQTNAQADAYDKAAQSASTQVQGMQLGAAQQKQETADTAYDAAIKRRQENQGVGMKLLSTAGNLAGTVAGAASGGGK